LDNFHRLSCNRFHRTTAFMKLPFPRKSWSCTGRNIQTESISQIGRGKNRRSVSGCSLPDLHLQEISRKKQWFRSRTNRLSDLSHAYINSISKWVTTSGIMKNAITVIW
jgi:hypothetical protein